MQAGRAAPQGSSPNPPAEVRHLQESLQGANHVIASQHEHMDMDAAAWADERLKLCHKVHNGRYRVNRLEGLIDLRESKFKDELKRSIETVSKQQSEISRLKTSLESKEEQMEAAQRFSQEQMEKMAARLEAEKLKVSELRDQMFKASLESQMTASLQKESQVKVDHLKQQLQQRDTVILDLRKDKEAVSQKLVETSAQLRRKEKEVLQAGSLWEQKYQALRELVEEKQSRIEEVESKNKSLVEKENIWMTRVQQLENKNIELVNTWMTRVQQLENNNKELVDREKTLTTRIQEENMEDKKTTGKEQRIEKEEKKLQESLQGANHVIASQHEHMDMDAAAWADERLKLCHKVHNGRYRVNRLEGLIDLRESKFKDELKRSIETVSKQQSEISRLKTSLESKEEQMEAAQRFSQEQMEKMAARLEAEKLKVSELRDQMFKASLESQMTASLQKESQVKVDHLKQQLQQRDTVILDLRKDKEAVSQKLVETSAQLGRKEKEVLQAGSLWEQKYQALRELVEEKQSRIEEVESKNKSLVEKESIWMTRVQQLENKNIELVNTWMTRVQQLENNNKELVDREKTLTTRIQEENMEDKKTTGKEQRIEKEEKKLQRKQ
uniref:golgin subfamily A member 6-like protein 26 n=1 Tax=Semicossyphus pulcher TaxID=241346 RepID=UPI0037E99F97